MPSESTNAHMSALCHWVQAEGLPEHTSALSPWVGGEEEKQGERVRAMLGAAGGGGTGKGERGFLAGPSVGEVLGQWSDRTEREGPE